MQLRKVATVAGWIVTGILLIVVVASKYKISLVERSGDGNPQVSQPAGNQVTNSPSGAPQATRAKDTRASSSKKEFVVMNQALPTENRAANEPPAQVQLAKAPESTAAPSPELTAHQLYQLAAPSVVLIEVFNEQGQKYGQGSGFVASSNGSVVTNYHVIRGAHSAQIKFSDGSSAQVSGAVGFDRDRDVAVIRVASGDLQAAKLGDSGTLEIGQRLVAIGSPSGLQNTLTDGLVSGIREGYIQMSTPISPGSSGGPVFNQQGEVVGVAVAGVRDAQNLNFAVPINWAKRYLTGPQTLSLGEIAHQSTVVQTITNQTFSIAAGQKLSWHVDVEPNQMTAPELGGAFSSQGGLGGNIQVLVLAADNRVLYDSGRTRGGNFRVPLPAAGRYFVVIDNSGSMVMSRTVNANFALRYTR